MGLVYLKGLGLMRMFVNMFVGLGFLQGLVDEWRSDWATDNSL